MKKTLVLSLLLAATACGGKKGTPAAPNPQQHVEPKTDGATGGATYGTPTTPATPAPK